MLRARYAAPALLSLGILAACSKDKTTALRIQTEPVTRREIVVDAEATGAVEPINVIEVKSKASGQIIKMTVETGAVVKAGDLLVQIDTRDVQNQYDQAFAALRAAESRMTIAAAAKKRNDALAQQRIITTTELEGTTLDYANAQSALVGARTSLDLAKQRLEDATVRAPVDGTIIEKDVSVGTVIASATGSVSGGTTLLKMADLSQVRSRALVNETDIGSIKAGQQATVTVDAYPNRPFVGTVEKIEPQAVVQQSVTMFPVLVTLDNRAGLLKPGMNGEVSVLITRKQNVLSVSNDAIRNPREAAAVASALGLSADSVAAAVQAQMKTMQAQLQQQRSAGDSGAVVRAAGGDVAAAGPMAGGRAPGDTSRRRRMAQGGAGDSTGGRGQGGGYQRGGGAGGAGGAAGATGAGGAAGGARARTALVFVASFSAKDTTYEPRLVRTGVSNFDYTEILSGVKEGEQVALLGAAALQASRQATVDRIRNATGGALQRQTPAATPAAGAAPAAAPARGGGGGGGGGRRGGGL
jgi:HlyD family secretion protein